MFSPISAATEWGAAGVTWPNLPLRPAGRDTERKHVWAALLHYVGAQRSSMWEA